MKVLSKPDDKKLILEFEEGEFLATDDGALIEEVTVPNSESWSSKARIDVAKRVGETLGAYSDVIELTIRVNHHWTLKRLIRPERLVPRVEDELKAEKEKA